MEIGITKIVPVQAKTLCVHLKVCDEFSASLKDQDGKQIGEDYSGYVPAFMPGEHYGDYLILDIDVDTGVVTNWIKPTSKDLEITFVNKSDEED